MDLLYPPCAAIDVHTDEVVSQGCTVPLQTWCGVRPRGAAPRTRNTSARTPKRPAGRRAAGWLTHVPGPTGLLSRPGPCPVAADRPGRHA
jgi:hypothetical protein